MTAQTEAAPAVQKPQVPGTPAVKGAGKGLASVTLTGAMSWVSGVATNAGWHVHLPFLATWMVLLVVVMVLIHFTGLVSWAWHRERAAATAEITSRAKLAEALAEQWIAQSGLAEAFAAELSKVGK